MAKIKTFLFIGFIVGFCSTVSAQSITVDETYTVDQLVKNILINNPCITVSNISFNGLSIGSGSSIGHFTDGGTSFALNEGIILSTGKALSAVGPNTSILSEGPASWGGDSDLEQALGVNNSINASVLEFDFLPRANKISFDYIFSSEQYLSNPSPNQCSYTDGFVFLLRKANTTDPYENLALVPGTGIPVKVNTVRGSGTICPPSNETYFGGFNGANYPTNFNGQTVVLKAATTVEPGTLYHIKLVVADQGNNLYDSAIFLGANSFKIEKDLGPDRLLSTNNPVCAGDSILLDATEPGTNTYNWYKDNILQPEHTPTYNVTQPGTYRSEVTINSTACVIKGEITVEYAAPLNLNQATVFQCDEDNDGTTIFNLSKADGQINTDPNLSSPVYFENITDSNPIANPQNYTSAAPKTIYAKVTNSAGCSKFIEVFLRTSNTSAPIPAPIPACDDDAQKDGIRQFNLLAEVTPIVLQGLPASLIAEYYNTPQEALSEINALPNLFQNTDPFEQQIWVKILNGPDCYDVIPVTLKVNVFNGSNFQDEEIPLCSGSFSDLIAPPGYVSYLWDDANASTSSWIRVTTPKEYTVTVTDSNGCSETKKFIVTLSEAATITDVVIDDFRGNANTVLITFTGAGDYEFSLDGNNYQDDPLFKDVESGQYTVYVHDKNRCGTATKTIFVLDYPKFFTPNNDGFNDFWKIPFLYKYPSTKVSVFDRYGKLVYAFKGNSPGWDGKLNSKPLPSTDYWFEIVLENGRIIKGHFALKR